MLIVANTLNIGADLGGMAEVTEMMTGVSSYAPEGRRRSFTAHLTAAQSVVAGIPRRACDRVSVNLNEYRR